jgi:hypothetical protein
MDVIGPIVNRPRADRVQVAVIAQGKATYYCNAAYSNKLALSEVPAGHPHKSYAAMHGPHLDLEICLRGSMFSGFHPLGYHIYIAANNVSYITIITK